VSPEWVTGISFKAVGRSDDDALAMESQPHHQATRHARSQFLMLVRLTALTVLLYGGSLQAAPVNFQSGTLSVTQTNSTTWTTVNFTRSFVLPPVVVMGPATRNNGDPIVMRVRNVTASSFQYQVDEWDYLTGDHPAETVHYFALSEGAHLFGSQRWQVGRVSGVNRTPSSIALSGFSASPVVLAQVETTANLIAANNPRALKTRIGNVTAAGFQVRLETQESFASAISNEGIGYVAVSGGTGYLDGKVLSAVTTGAVTTQAFGAIMFPGVRTNPVFIAQTQTINDTNPGELRMQSLSTTGVQIQFQEETSSSADVTHTAEAVGYLVLGDMSGELAAKIEVGDIAVTQTNALAWTTVTLANSYTSPVVVMGPLSYTGSTALTVRVQNVTSTSFQFQVDRWDHHATQTHTTLEQLSYIVMEAGTHAVGGVIWQAGQRAGVTQATDSQALSSLFTTAPAVFAQVGSSGPVVDDDAVQARVSGVSATGFSVELDESEIDATPHAAETVHWIAMSQGSSNFFSTARRFQAGSVTGTATTATGGIDSAFRTRSFSRMHADPFLFASMQSKNDLDPATLRWRYLFADRVDLIAQEDGHPAQFGEGVVDNNHAAETVAFLTVQGAVDTDEDGAPDAWENTVGLNANDASDGSLDGDGDLMTNQQEYHNRLNFATSSSHTTFTGGTVTIGNAVTSGFEVDDRSKTVPAAINARYRITRNGGFAPMTVNFGLAGTAVTDTTRAPASAADYTLWTANTGGTQLTGSIALAANAQSVDVFVRPVVDAIDEYPEGLRCTLVANGTSYVIGSANNTVVLINDAQNIVANERLFVGTFLPQASSGAVTGASGFATIIVNGSNSAGRISTSFNGLTTPQTAIDGSHLHYANTGLGVIGNGTIVYGDPDGLPNGLLSDYPWTIRDSAGAKAQDIINALYRKITGVSLYVNVHTDRYSGGEIRADLTLQTGSAVFTAPPAAPGLEDLANEEEVRRECARFLTQATFGASEADITALFNSIGLPRTAAANRITAFGAWISTQWARDQTTLIDYLRAADAQEWVLRGQQAMNDVNNVPISPAAYPPNNPADWTRWSSTVGNPPIPTGLNKESFDLDNNNRRRAWWLAAVRGHDQLRQRVASALEQTFIVSDREGTVGTRAYGHARYFDMLADYADGVRHIQPPNSTFSSANGAVITVRQLLEDVSKHPIMGKYLSHLKNQKAQYVDANLNGVQDANEETTVSPDENYAREIMQLFSIGLLELHPDGTLKLGANGQPIGTYDNDDIKELSKVFTGYSFAFVQNSSANNYVPPLVQGVFLNASEGQEYFHPGYENPMKNFVAFHDESQKVFLSLDHPAYSGSSADTAAREAYAEAELDATMDTLFNHPNIAPFLCERLIKRLVTSNPSRGYVHRVSQVFADSNGSVSGGVRGDLGAVVRAILLDYEARTLKNVDPQTIGVNTSVNVGFGKVKEPIVRYVQLLRAFGAKSQLPVGDLTSFGYPAGQLDNLGTTPTRYRYVNTVADLAQAPNNMPSVFNWYLPDYTPGGRVAAAGLVAPELQVMTENLVVRAVNYHRQIALSNVIDSTATALPTGQGGSGLLGDAAGLLDNVFVDVSGLVTDYIGNRQEAGATEISAATYLVDRLDMLLCAGSLKTKYPTYVLNGVDPRSVMIDQLAKIAVDAPPVSVANGGTRVRYALYLMTSTPEYIVQK